MSYKIPSHCLDLYCFIFSCDMFVWFISYSGNQKIVAIARHVPINPRETRAFWNMCRYYTKGTREVLEKGTQDVLEKVFGRKRSQLKFAISKLAFWAWFKGLLAKFQN